MINWGGGGGEGGGVECIRKKRKIRDEIFFSVNVE